MHSNTFALDSFPYLAYLLGPSSSFPFCSIYGVLSTLYTSDTPLNEKLKLPFFPLSNWSEKSLTCQIPEGEGGLAGLHLPISMAEPEHHMAQDYFSLDFLRSVLPWWA